MLFGFARLVVLKDIAQAIIMLFGFTRLRELQVC